ncbi:MAG: TonB-dependent receptor [Burkholderiaceae bacterium]|nr:TonB-dependent receptor [Burkholderiaceae bacterium]
MNRKLTPIASAVALMFMGASMAAQAQQAADQQTETVTVTGIRGSLQKSLEQKRNNIDHVDVITSEDIGKMPDKNVADSLQRVPGVTISSAGATEGGFDEADRVSMRGTNPSLTQTLINGHGVASGDWFVLDQGQGTVGRSVSYTLVPSELVGSVVVHKSSEASLVEGGVAGSVDIITRKPLDFKNQFTAEATLGAVYADLPSTTDPQVNGLINWKNDQKTFGILVQAFSEKRHLERQGQEMLNWDTIDPKGAIATAHPDLAGVAFPGVIGSTLFTQDRTRTGGEFDAQFKVSNDFSFDINGFSSLLKAPNFNRNYLLSLQDTMGGSGGGQSPNPGYQVINGVLTGANFAAVPGNKAGQYDQISRPDESESSRFLALEAKLRANSDLTFVGKAGVSSGEGKTPHQDVSETYFGTGAASGYQMNGINSGTSWYVGNNDASSPAAAGTTFGWVFGDQFVDVKDTENWAQIDGDWTIASGVFTTLQFGARFNSHERKSGGVVGQGPGCSGGPLTWSGTYNCGASTASSYNLGNLGTPGGNYPSGFGSAIGGSFPNNVFYWTPDQLAAYGALANRSTNGTREDWNNEFDVKENDGAAYVQSNFEGDRWSGNAGVRFVETREHSVSNVPQALVKSLSTPINSTSAFGPYGVETTDHTYTDVLPSLNLKFDLTKDLVGRFAASKTMTRPDYSALAGNISPGAPPVVVNGTVTNVGGGTAGNPDLQPIISNNIDATIEWYFAPHALLSASLFDMDLTSYIGSGTKREMIQSAGGPGIYAGQLLPYDLTVPINVGANVKGAELSYEQPIGTHFGMSANYTYVNAADSGGNPVVGASKNTGNLSGYYEDEHFNFRLAYNYRSSFYNGLDRNSAFFQAATATLSGTVGYKLNDNISFTLDGMNLNNPVLKYYGAAGESQPERFYVNGRQYYLSMHVKY